MSDVDKLPPLADRPWPELIAKARAFRDSGVAPAPAVAAATVLLLRDGADGFETFMIRRLAAMSFAAGRHVFPGGTVDASDKDCPGIDEPLKAAAIRETFEEAGLLLADGLPTDPDGLAVLEADRLALIAHEMTLGEVLARHDLVPRPDLLQPWSRWVTPDFEPRRYDTWFFVARAPENCEISHTEEESDASQWVTPASALAATDRGEWLLMPPTAATLRELLAYGSAAEVLDAAKQRVVRPLVLTIDVDADPPRFVWRNQPTAP